MCKDPQKTKRVFQIVDNFVNGFNGKDFFIIQIYLFHILHSSNRTVILTQKKDNVCLCVPKDLANRFPYSFYD